MKFYLLSILITVVTGRPSNEILQPVTYVLGTPIQSQYHSQDYLGQYAYGYNDGLSAKVESRYLDGTTQGGYTYYDANGKLQSISYIADDQNGFRVSGTNIPKAIPAPETKLVLEKLQLQQPQQVSETPEVSAARAQHLKAIEEAKNRNVQNELQNQLKSLEQQQQQQLNNLPKQVEDTPEVAKAKEEHLAALKEAELRNANLLKIQIAQSPAVLELPQPNLPALPLQAVKLLPSSLQPVALLNPSKGIPLPYGAANNGWAYGYSNLAPLGYGSRYFYVGQNLYQL